MGPALTERGPHVTLGLGYTPVGEGLRPNLDLRVGKQADLTDEHVYWCPIITAIREVVTRKRNKALLGGGAGCHNQSWICGLVGLSFCPYDMGARAG
jgi:hypothetical protein